MKSVSAGARRSLAVLAVLGCSVVSVGALCPTPSNPPIITGLTPSSGPAGTIVAVRGTRFGTGGSILFDSAAVTAEGTGSPLIFTVPYGTAAGTYDVQAVISGSTTPASPFQVTAPATAPTPTITAVSFSYYSLGPAGTEDVIEVVVYGTGFDTDCVIEWDGAAKSTGIPGIPAGSLLGLFSTSVVLPGLDPDHYDKALVSFLAASSGDLPALGSTHSLEVKNPKTSTASGSRQVTVPGRRVLVELDRIDSVAWPPSSVFRGADLHSLPRAYTGVGLLVDDRLDSAVTDPLAGADFDDSDVTDFFNTHAGLDGDVYTGQWYFHGGLVTQRDEPNPSFITYGRMYDTSNRQGLVMFVNSLPNTQEYLRSLMHEMGHGFNLSHCEGDATVNTTSTGGFSSCPGDGTTIMNQSGGLGTGWAYTFTNASVTHVTTHAVGNVAPGPGNLSFNSSSRTEGACGY